MQAYTYRALDAGGKRVAGTVSASTRAEAQRRLSVKGLYSIRVNPFTTHSRAQRVALIRTRAASRMEVAEAFETLGNLVAGGIGLMPALRIAEAGTIHPALREALASAAISIKGGMSLSRSMAKRPQVFPALSVGLVAAGEESGSLEAALDRIAALMRREDQERHRTVKALMYPAILAMSGLVTGAILLLFVVPGFAAVLEEAGGAVPLSTRLTLSLSRALPLLGGLGALGCLGAVAAAVMVRSRENGRVRLERAVMAFPGLGEVVRWRAVARFCRTLAGLLGAGIVLERALSYSARASGSDAVSAAATAVREAVLVGQPLWRALQMSALFPTLVHQLVRVGEESGALEDVLNRAAHLLEQYADRKVERLLVLIEPALVVTIGLLIGLVAVSLLQAIMALNNNAF
jgi:type II secretory pathway component PulF